ncbi:hypothetical protein EWM64_g9085 [Hericium alpestre]|uniref:Uncharacterized protein n=1 Tax=Hericium alpestre TaxID=135208 RepID=A0A4Y9ZLF9_9AGAM|nr:hypothetical protein EWM64_g9085 [Hericium alpestre]
MGKRQRISLGGSYVSGQAPVDPTVCANCGSCKDYHMGKRKEVWQAAEGEWDGVRAAALWPDQVEETEEEDISEDPADVLASFHEEFYRFLPLDGSDRPPGDEENPDLDPSQMAFTSRRQLPAVVNSLLLDDNEDSHVEDVHKTAAREYGEDRTVDEHWKLFFDKMVQASSPVMGSSAWTPFASEMDWLVAKGAYTRIYGLNLE